MWWNLSGLLNNQSDTICICNIRGVSDALASELIGEVVVAIVAEQAKTSPIYITSAYYTKTAVTHQSLDSMLPRRKMNKNMLPWNGYHPARKFIFDEIISGCITPDIG